MQTGIPHRPSIDSIAPLAKYHLHLIKRLRNVIKLAPSFQNETADGSWKEERKKGGKNCQRIASELRSLLFRRLADAEISMRLCDYCYYT